MSLVVSAEDAHEVFTLSDPADASLSLDYWLPLLLGWTVDCSVAEVGSTGVPGLPTKGDLDVAVVAVGASTWQEAVTALGLHLTPHEPQHWSATWASLRGDAPAGDVGVQVVVAGSEEDAYLRGFRSLLLRDPHVVERYRALKVKHDGGSMKEYRAAKGRFVEVELAAQGHVG